MNTPGTVTPTVLPDRSKLIRFLGFLQMGLGCILALVGLFVGTHVPSSSDQPQSPLLLALVIMGVGIALVWFGNGSRKLFRWARPVALVLAWIWLVGGAILTSAVVFSICRRYQVGDIVMLFLLVVIPMLVLPGVMLLIYSRPSVRQTFERHDPAPAWTDNCPVPVLIMCAITAWAAFTSAISRKDMPYFGVALPSHWSIVAAIASAAICLLLTYGLYRLKMLAWAGTLVWHALWCLSALIGMPSYWERINTPPGMRVFAVWVVAVIMAALIVYQLYLLRYFRAFHRPTNAA